MTQVASMGISEEEETEGLKGQGENTSQGTTPVASRALSRTSSLCTPVDMVEISTTRLTNLIKRLVLTLQLASHRGDGATTKLDLQLAAHVLGELVRGEPASNLEGVVVEQGVTDLLNVLSAAMDKARVVYLHVAQEVSSNAVVQSQAQHWGSQVPTQEELAALGRDAGSSKTVAALMHGREQLRGRLEGMLESGAMGEVRKRGARVVGKLLGEAGQEGLLMHKGMELSEVLSGRMQARMGDVEDACQQFLMQKGLDQGVAKELIHAARGEMETHTLENLYNKYQTNVASAVAETSDCLLNQDHTELVNEVVGHLEKAKVWATEHGAGAAVHQAEDAGREVESLASSLTQTEMVQYLKNNPTLVTSMKNILKESFAGNLPYRSLAGDASVQQRVRGAAADAIELAASQKEVVALADQLMVSATNTVASLSNLEDKTLRELVEALTENADIVTNVLSIVQMLVPDTEDCTQLTIARLVALVNDTEGVVERAATRLVELAGDMSLEKVVDTLAKRREVADSVMAALATALPSTQMTLRQLAIHLADPQAAQHVAVKLVDEGRTLTLGQLVELGSKDPQTRQSAMTTINSMLHNESAAQLTLMDLLGGADDDTGAHVAEDLVKGADSLLSTLEAVSMDSNMAGMLDRCEDKLYTQLATLNVNDLVRDGEAALTDEDARDRLVNRIKDSALDFFLEVLPNLPVPPIEGVKDGVAYNITDLDLSGVKLKKEDVSVHIGKHKGTQSDSLLSIKVSHISALFQKLSWSYEQTYFPYLKGEGKALAEVIDSEIALSFNLRLKDFSKDAEKVEAGEWDKEDMRPVICLRAHEVEMQGLDLKIEGGTSALTWVYNLLVSVFAELIKQYLTAALQDVIQENAGDLLDTLNGLMTPAIWPMLLRVCAVQLHELAPVTDKDVYSSIATEGRGSGTMQREVEMLFRKNGILGMQLDSDNNRHVQMVMRLIEGGMAEKWCADHGYPPAAVLGAEIVAVNGYRVRAGEEGASQCIEWLSTSRRPLSVALKLRPGALKLARAKGHVSTDEEKKKSAMFIPGPF